MVKAKRLGVSAWLVSFLGPLSVFGINRALEGVEQIKLQIHQC